MGTRGYIPHFILKNQVSAAGFVVGALTLLDSKVDEGFGQRRVAVVVWETFKAYDFCIALVG